jgi:hypothetical protein
VRDTSHGRLLRNQLNMDGDITVAGMDLLNQGDVIGPTTHNALVMDGDVLPWKSLKESWQQAPKGQVLALPLRAAGDKHVEHWGGENKRLLGGHSSVSKRRRNEVDIHGTVANT